MHIGISKHKEETVEFQNLKNEKLLEITKFTSILCEGHERPHINYINQLWLSTRYWIRIHITIQKTESGFGFNLITRIHMSTQ
jgi:hypothetical protein